MFISITYPLNINNKLDYLVLDIYWSFDFLISLNAASTRNLMRNSNRFEESENKKTELLERQREEENKDKQNAFSNLFVKDKTLYFTRRNWFLFDDFEGGVLECSSSRIRTYDPPVNSRLLYR